jgi:hypothetical protein
LMSPTRRLLPRIYAMMFCPEHLMPTAYGNLAGDDDRALVAAILGDF